MEASTPVVSRPAFARSWNGWPRAPIDSGYGLCGFGGPWIASSQPDCRTDSESPPMPRLDASNVSCKRGPQASPAVTPRNSTVYLMLVLSLSWQNRPLFLYVSFRVGFHVVVFVRSCAPLQRLCIGSGAADGCGSGNSLHPLRTGPVHAVSVSLYACARAAAAKRTPTTRFALGWIPPIKYGV